MPNIKIFKLANVLDPKPNIAVLEQVATGYLLDAADGLFKNLTSTPVLSISQNPEFPEESMMSEGRNAWQDGAYICHFYYDETGDYQPGISQWCGNDSDPVINDQRISYAQLAGQRFIYQQDDLTTLSNLKEWLGLGSTDNDGKLSRLITAASAFVVSWLSRPIISKNYDEMYNGNGKGAIGLNQYPVTAISAVSIDDLPVDRAVGAKGLGFVLDSDILRLRGYAFSSGIQNVRVQYTAGYEIVPPDVEQAVIEICATRYKEIDRIGQNSKSIGGEVISFRNEDMPKTASTLLKQYKRVMSW